MPATIQFKESFWQDGAVASLSPTGKLLLARLYHKADGEGILEAGRYEVDRQEEPRSPTCINLLLSEIGNVDQAMVLSQIRVMLEEHLCFEYNEGRQWYLWFPTIPKYCDCRYQRSTLHPRPPATVLKLGLQKFPRYVKQIDRIDHSRNPLPQYYHNGTTVHTPSNPGGATVETRGYHRGTTGETLGKPGGTTETNHEEPRGILRGTTGVETSPPPPPPLRGEGTVGKKLSPPKSPPLPRGRLGSVERAAYLLLENHLLEQCRPSKKQEWMAAQRALIERIEQDEALELLAAFLEELPELTDVNGKPWGRHPSRALILGAGYRSWKKNQEWETEKRPRDRCPNCQTFGVPQNVFVDGERRCVVCLEILEPNSEIQEENHATKEKVFSLKALPQVRGTEAE